MNLQAWKPLDLLKVSAEYLASKKIPTPKLDAEILLCKVLNLSKRIDLYANFEQTVSPENLAAYRDFIRRRALREPVSRIIGEKEFMGINFKVNSNVLSPRPETELLVETALEILKSASFNKTPYENLELNSEEEINLYQEQKNKVLSAILDKYAEDSNSPDIDQEESNFSLPNDSANDNILNKKRIKKNNFSTTIEYKILDLGTGSGCIAISLAAMLPKAKILAVDISSKALSTAQNNAVSAGVASRIEFRESNWFSNINEKTEKFDIIISNPPYLIEGDQTIWPEVANFDPHLALYAENNGLAAYQAIIDKLTNYIKPKGHVLFEIAYNQGEIIKSMLEKLHFNDITIINDYANLARVVKAKSN